MRGGIAICTVLFLDAASSSSRAEDCSAPCAGYAITLELEDDWIFSADPASKRSNDLGPTLDAEFHVSPIDHLKLFSAFTTEQVLDKDEGANRAFGDIGTYLEKLYAEYESDPFVLRLGKINPLFGLATNELDGIYATDQVDNYDTDERWGVEAALNYEAVGLSHSLTANVFTTDRTFLSRSLFTDRGRASLSDGAAGNAEGLASFGVFLDGCKGAETPECFADGGFGYRLGFRYQKAGHRTADQKDEDIRPGDELTFLAAGTWRYEIDENILRVLGEAAYLENFEGGSDNAIVGTMAASLESGFFTYMATYSYQENLVPGDRNTKEDLLDLTAKYAFDEGAGPTAGTWSMGPAYGYSRDEEGQTTHILGFVLTLDLEGTTGGRTASAGDEN